MFQVGEILKEKFDSAHEVQQKKRRGRRMLLPRFQRFKPHTDTDLVYLRPSSDYCEMDFKKGSLGTHGRECDPVSKLHRDKSFTEAWGSVVAERSGALLHGTGGPRFKSRARNSFCTN